MLRFPAVAWFLLIAMSAAAADAPLAVDSFSLPDDLEVTLWAQAPQFFNPTNIDVDIRGRVWVAEAVNYRFFQGRPSGQLTHAAGDRIVVLEDTDGDGRADASQVFVQDADLVAPLGVAVFGNRVIVSCSPSLISYTDVDGDARFDPAIDKKEVFLTGFGGVDHDHGLHAVVAGPDGRWYFNAGNAGPHIVTDRAGWTLRAGSWYTGKTPSSAPSAASLQSDDGRVYVGGLAMTIRPDGAGLAVYAHNFRNNYETCVDSFGNVFQNDNDDQVAACRTTWLMQYANAGYGSADGRRSWRADQRPGQSVPRSHWHQDDPGVIPMGDLYGAGSPTGMAVYESDALGRQYRGMLLSCEAGRNAVFGYRVRPDGGGFSLERKPLLSSGLPDDPNYKWKEVLEDRRRWFRPSDVAVGTDGALYVADWFDPIVGGHAMHDRGGSGAIYRIAPKARRLSVPRIDLATTEGQIAALKSPAPNVRFLGFEQLRAGGASSQPVVQPLLKDANPYVRARAVWLLAQLGDPGRQIVSQLLTDPDADLRVVAIRALRQRASSAASGRQTLDVGVLRPLASDASPAVRREVSLALRDVPLEQCGSLLVELAKGFDCRDRWYLEAWGAACDGREDDVYRSLAKQWDFASPLDWDDRFAALVWRLHPSAAVTPLAARALATLLSEPERRQAIDTLAFIDSRAAAAAMAAVASGGKADMRDYAKWWISVRRHSLWRDFADALPPEDRAPSSASGGPIARFERVVLNSKRDIAARSAAAEKLAQTTDGALRLIALARSGKLPSEVAATVATHLHRHSQPSVRALASQFFPSTDDSRLKLPALEELAQLPGDATRGKQLVLGRAECAKCHRFGGEGKSIGPDLSGIGAKLDRTRLLESILNPSAAIVLGYESWLIATTDGRLISGFVVGEGDPVLIKDAEGRQLAIPADEIESRKRQTVSLMPDIGPLGLTPQNLADIAEFLAGQRSVDAATRPQ